MLIIDMIYDNIDTTDLNPQPASAKRHTATLCLRCCGKGCREPSGKQRHMAKSSKTASAPRPAQAAVSAAGVKALSVCAEHGNRPENLLEILHDIQDTLGHVPQDALPIIANALNLSRAEVYGVMSFYHDFKTAPGGKHTVKICRAEACQSMNTEKLCAHAAKKLGTAMGGVSADGLVSLEEVFCLGNCALSPAVLVDDKLYGKVDAKRFDAIIAGLEKEAAE